MGTSQGRLTVVIPCWSGTTELREMLLELCQQVRPMCDELVVSEDSDVVDREVLAISDKYHVHSRWGHARNLALGLGAATMDFVALIDSDVVITKGSVRDLCLPGKIVSPGLKGWFIVGPRKMLCDFPPFDNAYHIEGIDEWWKGLKETYRVEDSDKVSYTHGFNRTASEFQKWKRQQELEYQTLHPNKEIDIQRHKARLTEDPLYATLWSDA